MKQRTRGFTVVELMITIAIAAILMGLGVPSFRAFISGQKVKTGSYELMTSLVIARSEAVKRNASVTLTPTSSTAWANGWAVTGGGATLHSQEAIQGLTITTYTDSTCATAATVASIVFNNTGRAAASSCYKFTADHTSNARCVKVDLTGIPSSGSC
jgi:type IV fimbrial biogenesis protein FimT